MATVRTLEYFQCLIQRKGKVILKDNILPICNLHCTNSLKLLLEAASTQITVLFCSRMISLWSLLKMQITIMEFNIKNNLHWMGLQLRLMVTSLPFLGNQLITQEKGRSWLHPTILKKFTISINKTTLWYWDIPEAYKTYSLLLISTTYLHQLQATKQSKCG